MKYFIFAIIAIIAVGSVMGQVSTWQPSAGHIQIPIWPQIVPNARRVTGPETLQKSKDLVAGKAWNHIENVSEPSITVYSPKGRKAGAAVVVFPGGGYKILAIDLEGTEVCDWLNSKGITCVLLKIPCPVFRAVLECGL